MPLPDLKNCTDLMLSFSLLICSQPGTNTRMAPACSKWVKAVNIQLLSLLRLALFNWPVLYSDNRLISIGEKFWELPDIFIGQMHFKIPQQQCITQQ